jgi:hypothetical protein
LEDKSDSDSVNCFKFNSPCGENVSCLDNNVGNFNDSTPCIVVNNNAQFGSIDSIDILYLVNNCKNDVTAPLRASQDVFSKNFSFVHSVDLCDKVHNVAVLNDNVDFNSNQLVSSGHSTGLGD